MRKSGGRTMTHSDERSNGPSMSAWPSGGFDPDLERLQKSYVPSLARADVPGLLADRVLGRTAVVSSFGAESAALLHYANTIRPGIPVIFLDTGKHFPETLAYRDALVANLNLNLVVAGPNEDVVAREDPRGIRHASDPNACCTIRKTFPCRMLWRAMTAGSRDASAIKAQRGRCCP